MNPETNAHSELRAGLTRWAVKMIAMLVVFGAILFLAAGRLNWWGGWAFLGLNAFSLVLTAVLLIPRRPDMLAERSKMQANTKAWDRVLAPLVAMVTPLVMMITAGLDARFGWSGTIPPALWIAALLLAAGCQGFVLWAMLNNPFFAATVRIQNDRGQQVVRSGPYGMVRHPGYLGAVIFNLAAPLVLGSWWTFIPALISIGLNVLRTTLEDRTLQAELPGYREYAQAVRSRLFPGVW